MSVLLGISGSASLCFDHGDKLVEQGCDIARELYLGIVLDRAAARPVLMMSSEGGVEIEKVAEETPFWWRRLDEFLALVEANRGGILNHLELPADGEVTEDVLDRGCGHGTELVQNLARYAVVVFLNTTGDVLNDTQQTAFERYVAGEHDDFRRRDG